MRRVGFAAIIFVVMWLCGCQKALPPVQPTAATLPPIAKEATEPFVQPLLVTRSGRILEMLWYYFDGERFPCCGGSGNSLIFSAPGELELSEVGALTRRMYLPEENLKFLEDGASLTHLFQVNLFNCCVLRLKEGTDIDEFAVAWRGKIQKNQWLEGVPEQLLLMRLDSRHILMAVGKQHRVQDMQTAAKRVFADSRVLYHEGLAG